jgi:hypothetical protein
MGVWVPTGVLIRSRGCLKVFTISSKLMRKLGPALLLAGAMLGLLVTGPELAAQRIWGRPVL